MIKSRAPAEAGTMVDNNNGDARTESGPLMSNDTLIDNNGLGRFKHEMLDGKVRVLREQRLNWDVN